MTISFKNISTNLTTRNLGSKLRQDILMDISKGETIVFDFTGVDVVSNSFADECFAKLLFDFEMSDLKTKTTFKNANKFVSDTIAFAFQQRLQQLQTH